jgi:hypothetical protein
MQSLKVLILLVVVSFISSTWQVGYNHIKKITISTNKTIWLVSKTVLVSSRKITIFLFF